MSQGKFYRLEAIVLARRDQGEADRVLTVLTPEGRRDLLARGVRKPRSRKAGHLELFARTQLLVSRVTGSWDIISQAEVMEPRAGLQEDFLRGTYARYVAELALRFFEDDADSELYSLVESALALLEKATEPERVARWYEPRLLALAGFRPEWGTCVGEREGKPCRTPLRPRPGDAHPYGVDPERGGALCPTCVMALREERTVRFLSPSALSWLQALQRQPYADVAEFPLPPATAAELGRVMEHLIAYHLERRPAALRVIGQ